MEEREERNGPLVDGLWMLAFRNGGILRNWWKDERGNRTWNSQDDHREQESPRRTTRLPSFVASSLG